MIRKIFAPIVGSRFGFPLILACALVILIVNESTYRIASRSLDWGIALTDARLDAGSALQLLTDAETAQRGYLLTGERGYLQRYQTAVDALTAKLSRTVSFLRDRQGTMHAAADQLEVVVADKLRELSETIRMKADGKDQEAAALFQSGLGQRRMAEIRASFDQALDEAARMQTGARVSLYQSLIVNRVAVASLTCLAVLGLYLFLRQLREAERERNQYAAQLESDVLARTDDLRALATYVMSVREDERQRLARELHDELGGLLTAAKLDLARVRSSNQLPPELAGRVQRVNDRLNDGIALKRRIIEDLRPSALDQLGLTASLRLLCQDAAEGLGIHVEQDLAEVELPPALALTVYRLVQESLTNIRKYAHAKQVVVRLGHGIDQSLQVSVQDDGEGFNVRRADVGRHGLAGMRFRVESHGGSMQVLSEPGKGTTITASVPADRPTDPPTP